MNHRERIRTYLERGYWNRRSRVLNRIGLRISPFARGYKPLKPIGQGDADSIAVDIIRNPDLSLNKLTDFLRNQTHPAISGVCVFGSRADNTISTYSDFDGILLIDLNQVAKGRNSLRSLRSIIARTETMLLEMDALQHHGWHIVFTDDHPGNPELIPTGCLGPCFSLTNAFTLPYIGSIFDRTDFLRYSQKQQHALLRINETTSLFTFKSILSEFMLIPALYLQSTTAQAVSKKDSYSIIRTLLPAMDNSALETASMWRENWKQPDLNDSLPGLKRRFIYPMRPSHPPCTYTLAFGEIDRWRKAAMAYLDALCATLESGFQE